MHDNLLNELCSYSQNSTIGTHANFLILVKSSMDFTLSRAPRGRACLVSVSPFTTNNVIDKSYKLSNGLVDKKA